MRRSNRLAMTFLALALPAMGAAGCNDDSSTTVTNGTTTPTTAVTEAFSGSLSVNGATTFNFTANGAGAVTAYVKTMTPATDGVFGIALGTWNGSGCQIVLANDAAKITTTLSGATSAAGNLCVRVYDVGKLTAAQSIEVAITHF